MTEDKRKTLHELRDHTRDCPARSAECTCGFDLALWHSALEDAITALLDHTEADGKRIEALEAVLRDIIDECNNSCWANATDIARQALGDPQP